MMGNHVKYTHLVGYVYVYGVLTVRTITLELELHEVICIVAIHF